MHESKSTNHRETRVPVGARMTTALGSILLLAAVMLATTAAAAPGQKCSACGKNLIRNPGAESGAGITAVGAFGAVPGWTNTAGQFGAASYAFPNGWFSATSKGSPKRGKNYFFGGTTTEAVQAKASIGTQAIKLPAAAAGRKATLSGWLGNYDEEHLAGARGVRGRRRQGAGEAQDRPRHDDLRHGHGPSQQDRDGSTRRDAGDRRRDLHQSNQYNLAGADDLSLVLS